MQTQSNAATSNWIELAGAETIAKVEAAIMADPIFLAEALRDLNGAVERRMGITFSIPLGLVLRDGTGYVWPLDHPDELTDADLDLVSGGDEGSASGGSSVRNCTNVNECSPGQQNSNSNSNSK